MLYALVLKDATYLIVSPAEGTDQPAQAPGKDTTTAKLPGRDTTPTKLPGTDTTPVTDPSDTTPAEAPGLVDEPAGCKRFNGSKVRHDHHVSPQKFRQRFKNS